MKPKRKLTLKRFVIGTLTWIAMVLIISLSYMFSYHQGRMAERALWEPRWQMESTEYRLMPYGIDN